MHGTTVKIVNKKIKVHTVWEPP